MLLRFWPTQLIRLCKAQQSTDGTTRAHRHRLWPRCTTFALSWPGELDVAAGDTRWPSYAGAVVDTSGHNRRAFDLQAGSVRGTSSTGFVVGKPPDDKKNLLLFQRSGIRAVLSGTLRSGSATVRGLPVRISACSPRREQ
jgi:hypothetical protein